MMTEASWSSAVLALIKSCPESFHLERGGYGGPTMMTWERVSDLVSNYRFIPPRIRLAYAGSESLEPAFLSGGGVMEDALARNLKLGATLVIDAVDETESQIRSLAEQIESSCQAAVQANAYLSFGSQPGFGVHSDPHDVTIAQVIGRKYWELYGPRRSDAIPETSVWSGYLETGDILYLPRGWWHGVSSRDEATLHITFAITRPGTADFLFWFSQLRERYTMEGQLDQSANPESEFERFASDIGRDLRVLGSEASIRHEFVKWCRSRTPARGQAYFPHGDES